jgi:hypothetical protein
MGGARTTRVMGDNAHLAVRTSTKRCPALVAGLKEAQLAATCEREPGAGSVPARKSAGPACAAEKDATAGPVPSFADPVRPVHAANPRAAHIATYALIDTLRSEDVGADDLADHSG